MPNNQHNDFSKIFNILSTGNSNLKKKTADDMVSKLAPKEQNELKNILKDKEKLNSILNSPAVKEILNKLNSDKNG